MWTDTKITELLKIKLPLIQAPMAGGATTPELVAAVSNAGGLGSLGAGYMMAKEIRQAVRQIWQLTSNPFAVNLFIPEKHLRVPIIAAGGLMDAKGIIAALKAGASAVQMGTAFLCCNESGIHPLYKKLLLNTTQDNTTLTRAFSGKLARGIINPFITRMQSLENDILDYPIQNALTTAMRKEASRQGNIDFMSMWAGQSAHSCRNVPAIQFIQELNDEIIKLLKESR